MDLSCVHIQNFMSIADQVVDYRGSGLTLVTGPNGVGKSGLFVEPLLWLLYDELNRTASKQKPNKVRRRYRRQYVEEDTSVEAWFSQAGHEYYVKRSLSDGWSISADGSNITPYRTKSDALPVLEQVVGLPSNLFRSIAVMGQGFSHRFSDFKDSERTSIVEDFIGAVVYEEAHDYSKDRSKTVADRLVGLSQATAQAKSAVEKTKETLEQARVNRDAVKSQSDQKRKELEEECSQLGALRQQYEQNASALMGQQDTLLKEIGDLDGIRSVTQTNINNLNQTLGACNTAVTTLQSAKGQLENLPDVCPTCKNQVDRNLVLGEVQQLQVQIDLRQQEKAQVEQRLQQSHVQLQQTDTGLRDKRNQKEQVDLQITQARAEITRIDDRFQAIQTELSQLGDLDISYDRHIRDLESRLLQEEESLKQSQQAETEYTELQPYIGWWNEHLSVRGLRSWRLGGALESANKHLAASCMKLFDGQIMVRMLPVKPLASGKSKSVVSIDVESSAGSYEMSSGGQARCIDLALHFAFRRLAKSSANGWESNFLIGDEIFDHLDRQIAERALGVLRREAERVFLITHSQDLQAYCDSVMQIAMEDEQTKILVPGGLAV